MTVDPLLHARQDAAMHASRWPALALSLLLAVAPSTAWNCAPVPPAGMTVRTADETALIVWDAANSTEHFIRRARFETQAKDFGFLVPTPTQPELAEADEKVFDLLALVTAPRVVYLELPRDKKSAPMKSVGAVKSAPPPVQVLATAKVAGFDAAVLEATDANALDEWLKKNGYATSPELVDWFRPLIAAKWKITAFKVAADASGQSKAAAVRMSFRTEKPFYPYREPETQRKAGAGESRLLRVFLLSDVRFAGNIGADGKWPGETVWSGEMTQAGRDAAYELLKLPSVAGRPGWLTEFEDRASPRPGIDEVYFTKAADQSKVERPERIVHERDSQVTDKLDLTIGIVVLLLLFAAAVWLTYRAIKWIAGLVTKKPESP